jgi:hypothetical protein
VRCYFMRRGHIGAVEVVTDASDEAAIKQSETLFEQRKKDDFTGFEVWDCARFVHRHPPPAAKYTETVSGMTWNNPRASYAKYKEAQRVLEEARQIRSEARALPQGDIRDRLEAAADKLEAFRGPYD